MSDNTKRQSTLESEVEMNMTPMIDVTFQLLIFFLVTLQFRKLENKLDAHLPTDTGSMAAPSTMPEEKADVALRRRGDRTLVSWGGQALAGRDFDAACRELGKRLTAFHERFPEAKARLEAGPGVRHGDAVRALDAIHAAGFEVVVFGGVEAVRNAADVRRITDSLSTR